MTEHTTSSLFKRFKLRKARSATLKSGFMIIGEDGVARMDYADPKLRKHLERQIKQFSKIKVGA